MISIVPMTVRATPSRVPAHVVVAGTGVAGVCAAWALVEAGVRVTLVGDGRRGATALASLVNPFTGPKASPAWRWEASLVALGALLDACGARLRPGLVRPARDARQADVFRARAAAHSSALVWHEGGDVHGATAESNSGAGPPGLICLHGWLDVHVGGTWVDPMADLARLSRRLASTGALTQLVGRAVVAGDNAADAGKAGAWLDIDAGGARERLHADAIVLALGDGFAGWAAFGAMGLTRVGGRRYAAEHAAPDPLPAVAFGAYATPAAPGTVYLGGTYDHADPDAAPTPGEGLALVQRLQTVLPGLGGLVSAGEAAVRVHRASVRRPLVRRLPGCNRVWALTGLGSKGLLTAPLVARGLPSWLAGVPVPDELA